MVLTVLLVYFLSGYVFDKNIWKIDRSDGRLSLISTIEDPFQYDLGFGVADNRHPSIAMNNDGETLVTDSACSIWENLNGWL